MAYTKLPYRDGNFKLNRQPAHRQTERNRVPIVAFLRRDQCISPRRFSPARQRRLVPRLLRLSRWRRGLSVIHLLRNLAEM